ncbi:NAD-dependent epimerase/dehydratase family protein [Nocardia yunnanensis]|uniref:NAD-dependent epimerase/dehydratase family protein n=1 Tax=Nocardia yunnanensis TaxID=2382165 RepID=A0A386ZJR8_9NOCA|nr:SDR family NAD(P)-dependent oxidoreductase [Nocardia yunnanensis]AYF76869.1 NAD-dependent epimerase/dehydratase family protein [Nocardia yunnanensis]
MIVVTGATGTIGSEVVRQLAARGAKVRAVSRNPEGARVPDGVEVVRGDYLDPESLAAAFAGAEAAFLVGQVSIEDADTDTALITAARDAGVTRLVKLSAIGTGDTLLGPFAAWHMPGERAISQSGAVWTILRPSSFASNTLSWAAPLGAGRPVPNLTGSGAQGVVDPRDIAEVAVAALLSDDHAGRIYTLTGPQALSVPEQAAILGEVLGRRLEVADIPSDQVGAALVAAGRSEEFAARAAAGNAFVRKGGNTTVTKDIEQILGRAPRTYADWARDHATQFRV